MAKSPFGIPPGRAGFHLDVGGEVTEEKQSTEALNAGSVRTCSSKPSANMRWQLRCGGQRRNGSFVRARA
jgi:hypothetical protein